MKIAMVDSNVFDVLVDDAAARQAVLAAIEDKRLVLRTTHVQEDELAATPDKDRRTQLQQVVPRERVVTSVGVFGVSKWGAASFGGSEEYEAIRHGPNHIEDAIIAATAVTDAHVLVTEEKRLRNRAQARLTVPVWNVARLVEWATSGHPSDDSPLREAGRVLDEAEYLDLQSQVDAHGEALRLMHEALRALTREEHSSVAAALRASGIGRQHGRAIAPGGTSPKSSRSPSTTAPGPATASSVASAPRASFTSVDEAARPGGPLLLPEPLPRDGGQHGVAPISQVIPYHLKEGRPLEGAGFPLSGRAPPRRARSALPRLRAAPRAREPRVFAGLWSP